MDSKMIVCNGDFEDCECLPHYFLDCLMRGENDEAKFIMNNSKNFDRLADNSGHTWLHYSAKRGNAEMTQHLIDEGSNVNARDDSGLTPLMLAVTAECPDLETVRVLLNNNADIYSTDAYGNNSLTLAFYSIITSPFISTCMAETESASKVEALRLILKMFFDRLNSDFLRGKLTQYLLSLNEFAQLAVVVFGDAEVTRFMLDNIYSIDYCDPQQGETALHCAMRFARYENTRILIERGANLNALNCHNCSPLTSYPRIFEEVDENGEVLQTFLKYSIRLSVPGRNGFSIVEELLMAGNKKTVKTILLSGIDVEACFRDKHSTLLSLLVMRNDDVEVLDLFDELDIKFDVDEQNKNGDTALMVVTIKRSPKKVEFLLRHGADVNLRSDAHGLPALSRQIIQPCCERDDKDAVEVTELLLQYGADTETLLSNWPNLASAPLGLLMKIIVAHLAMLEVLKKPYLTDPLRRTIAMNLQLKTYFDLCTRHLEAVKDRKFRGTLTLLELLTYNEEEIAVYARNRELIAGFHRLVEDLKKTDLAAYYLNTMQRKLSRGQELAKLQAEAAFGIGTLTGLCADAYHSIVYRIISLLGHRDLCNLRKIGSDHSTMMEQ